MRPRSRDNRSFIRKTRISARMRVLSFYVFHFPRNVRSRTEIRILRPLHSVPKCYHIFIRKPQRDEESNMDKVKIGRFLADRRKGRKLTQAQLAEMLDVSVKTISRWERGIHLPDYDQVLAVCGLFGIDVQDFLKGDMTLSREDAQAGGIPKTDR